MKKENFSSQQDDSVDSVCRVSKARASFTQKFFIHKKRKGKKLKTSTAPAEQRPRIFSPFSVLLGSRSEAV
jgi:hypothetical protein